MRIVLVDASRTVLMAMTEMLEARQHQVLSFIEGRAALECIRDDASANVLITSSEPDGMPGLELCWEARLLATSRRPLHIIFMSSTRDDRRIGEALDSGADDFIAKPPSAEELYARLRAAERLDKVQSELVRLATTDPLTGVLNRRAFFELAEDVIAKAGTGGVVSAVMFDIDHFKKVNDGYGHDVGDEVLREVAAEAAMTGAAFGRLGGEEFAALFDNLDRLEAGAVAEWLRRTVAELEIKTPKGPLTVTCSLGVAQWQRGETVDQLLKRADVALYRAKSSGRDRVVIADDFMLDTVATTSMGIARGPDRPRPDGPGAAPHSVLVG